MFTPRVSPSRTPSRSAVSWVSITSVSATGSRPSAVSAHRSPGSVTAVVSMTPAIRSPLTSSPRTWLNRSKPSTSGSAASAASATDSAASRWNSPPPQFHT